MSELEFRVAIHREWLESWVENNEKPDCYDWLGFYPAKASVDAAKAALKAMDNNIVVTQEEALEVFVK
ncbi:MAG: hypothetical protein JKY95_19755 [Planctomycetaceae bacterium]|nr:hypothetical protein [Planctomycetaceae bacterium]